MALTKCHECGQDVSTQAKACPTCGAKVKKPSGTRLILFLLAVLGVFGLITLATKNQQTQPPSSTPAPLTPEQIRGQSKAASDIPAVSKPISPAEHQRKLKEEVMNAIDFKMTWEKGGFGTVLVADVTLTNKSAHPVKDVELLCVTVAESGTELGRQRHTIYESFDPKKTKTVSRPILDLFTARRTRSATPSQTSWSYRLRPHAGSSERHLLLEGGIRH